MFKLGLIGLDTSHSIEFTKLIQGEARIATKLQVINCMRFPTPFQSEPDQDKRQSILENLGVNVTRSFEAAVQGVDGIMIEINDPALHLEYFEKCSELDLPVFLDKPLADDLDNGIKIYTITEEKNMKVWSASSLRFTPELVECSSKVTAPQLASAFGPLGKAPSGNSLIWYGVHTFEMLMVLMGPGAKSIFAREDEKGIVAIVTYKDGRRGIVECNSGVYVYGGRVQGAGKNVATYVTSGSPYPNLITALENFFIDGTIPVDLKDTLEIQAMMEACRKSLEKGTIASVFNI